MEKNSEASEIIERSKDADHTGFSEKQIDLLIEGGVGEDKAMKQGKTPQIPPPIFVSSHKGQQAAADDKKVVTVFPEEKTA